jgi:Ca-activated chloride channel family protein
MENPLNATAIGDGLQRAVLSLITAQEDLAREQEDQRYTIKSRAVIVLTDGQNNTGMSPTEAGEYAAANDVKVYFIVLMDRNVYRRTMLGRTVAQQLSQAAIDQFMAEPNAIGAKTGGQAWFAADGNELREVYKTIDQLERTKIGRIEFRTYQERYHWALIPAMAMLALTTLLGETILRRIP